MAALMLFDPALNVIGPTAFVVQDLFGNSGFLRYALVYPTLLGALPAFVGYGIFRRGDLL